MSEKPVNSPRQGAPRAAFQLPGEGWPELLPGHVWLCGAGPGDPGLLTLHALNALEQCDVIVHDALIGPGVLALVPEGVERLSAGKRGGRASPKQGEISARLIALARAGRRVVRLKGGDPYLFGRGGEEAEALVRAHVPIRVIPGITAGIGGLAHAGIPATHRDVNQAVTFISGHDPSGRAPALDWAAIARGSPVIVIYMGMRNLAEISAALIAGGRAGEEPVAILQEATLPGQRLLETTLARAAEDARAAGIGAPAVICIGEAVRHRDLLDWRARLAASAGGAP